MKLTTAMLISTLALGTVAANAQSNGALATTFVGSQDGNIAASASTAAPAAAKTTQTANFIVHREGSLVIPTNSSMIGSHLNARQIESLPMEDRNVMDLIGGSR